MGQINLKSKRAPQLIKGEEAKLENREAGWKSRINPGYMDPVITTIKGGCWCGQRAKGQAKKELRKEGQAYGASN